MLVGGMSLVGRAVIGARGSLRLCGPGSRVICSTDCEEVASEAVKWGAEVPFVRPTSISGDDARSLDVVRHALDALDGKFDAVALLQPTSPFRNEMDILGALSAFFEWGDPVVSVCRNEHPMEWCHRLTDEGVLRPAVASDKIHRRQLSERLVRPNGAVYVASPAQVMGAGFWTDGTRAFVMEQSRSFDVDTPDDLRTAAAIASFIVPPAINLGAREVGPGRPCFVIAEAGVNHNGSIGLAMKLVDAARAAGADAVKFQSFKADKVVSPGAPKAEYQERRTTKGESQLEMIRALELSERDHRRLAQHCRESGILFLSSPFDEGSADLLESLGVPAFKIGSGEVTNIPFLRYLAAKGLPLILSTGMSTLPEVATAVDAMTSGEHPPIALLQCVSNYPASAEDVNLRAMNTMREAFGVVVGYSDHTTGSDVALAAVALGASIVEKHFTLDRSMPGPDHAASVEPRELAEIVIAIRRVEAALGDGVKVPAPSEVDTARAARRSLFAARAIETGELLDVTMICARRPGTGMGPDCVDRLLGRRAIVDIPEGTLLEPGMFE